MGALFSLAVVTLLVLFAYVGVEVAGMQSVFGIVIPYVAVLTIIIGIVYRVVKWGKSPVPFAIATTCGQQQSFPWINQNKLDNPSTTAGVIGRMLLEILFFRSLFRNTNGELRKGNLAYGSAKWLWLAALAFHWSFLIILLRHMRLFGTPVASYVGVLEGLDGFLQVGAPRLFLTGVILLIAVSYLLYRRLAIRPVRYISLAADYFPLFLILSIAASGILMRYFFKVDMVSVKELTMGLVSLNPVVPAGIGTIFYVHVFLVSALFIYFPSSKLMHAGGVFLSPTRNLANDTRMKRHVNPWDYPVKLHTYEEYENDFREVMVKVGLPVDVPLAEAPEKPAETHITETIDAEISVGKE
jgi:nitrate reductase gamma subunit